MTATIADALRAEDGRAPYAYTDAHDHRLTLRATLHAFGKPYVWAEAENLAIGGDITSVWLTLEQVAALDRHLDTAVPASFTDHTGDTLTVAYSHAFTFFEVTRVADEDDDAAAVRVVALTARLPELRAAFKATAERAQRRADEHAAAQQAEADQSTPDRPPGLDALLDHVAAAQPAAEDIAQNIRDAVTYSSDTASPVLATVRDLVLTLSGSTPASALASARIILAAHTRELAVTARLRAGERGAEMRAAGNRQRVTWCAGMNEIVRMLGSHADALDAAAVDGD